MTDEQNGSGVDIEEVKRVIRELKSEGAIQPVTAHGLLTTEQVLGVIRRYIEDEQTSESKVARRIGTSVVFFNDVLRKERTLGPSVYKGFHLERIQLYRLVED